MDVLQPADPASVGGYRLLGRLGAGGMGQVYLGVSPGGRTVAIKLIHASHAQTAYFKERFAREVEAARRVGGFHTATVVDADPGADPPWMVTAYIEGPSLQEAVVQGGPMPPDRVRALGAALAEGLAAIHACGLVHRDLKPSNVILAADGPRIIDFGIARTVDAHTGITSTGTLVGTFAYMSPEQMHGDQAGPASDVFSLGGMLAFAATGRPPFGSDSPPAIMYRVINEQPDLAGLPDPSLATLISACLAKAPEARPSVPDLMAAVSRSGSAPGHAPVVPPQFAADGPPTQTQLSAPRSTGPTREITDPLAAAGPAQPGYATPNGLPPALPPTGSPPTARLPRRRFRRGPVIAAAALVVALAIAVPLLLTSSTPKAAPPPSTTSSTSLAPSQRPSTTPSTGASASTQPTATATPTASAISGVRATPAQAQQIAKTLLPSYGWGTTAQYTCLVNLWNKLSGWAYNDADPSGSYGIPQALPGSRMASAGADWKTNATTQIKWGLGYIKDNYGSPCSAYASLQKNGYY
jgi:serine/threonine protein kinase